MMALFATWLLGHGLFYLGQGSGPTYEIMPFEKDNGTAWRRRLGIIILDVDEVIEEEFPKILDLPDGVVLYHARMGKGPAVTADDLKSLTANIPNVSKLLPPFPFAAIGFACTSAAVEIGELNLGKLVEKGLKSVGGDVAAVNVTNPMTAAKRALTAVGAKKVAVLTPYTEDITVSEVDNFIAAGFVVEHVGYFNRTFDANIVRITPESVLKAIIDLVRLDTTVDAIFVSCTNVRILDIVQQAEQLTGKNVISSNTALAWDLMRIAGLLKPNSPVQAKYGKIFSLNAGEVSDPMSLMV